MSFKGLGLGFWSYGLDLEVRIFKVFRGKIKGKN